MTNKLRSDDPLAWLEIALYSQMIQTLISLNESELDKWQSSIAPWVIGRS